MVKVKICGITNLDDALLCVQEGADLVGFIFWPKSPRCISPATAKKIIKNIGPFVWKVGVFVNEDKEKVRRIASDIGLDVLQFHGDESPSYCKYFRSEFHIIKTLFPDSKKDVFKHYSVDAYLLDVRWEKKARSPGTIEEGFIRGTMRRFKGRVIVSGGLSPDNVASYIRKFEPYGVDVARGVELFPGKKDPDLVKKFIRKVKSYGIS